MPLAHQDPYRLFKPIRNRLGKFETVELVTRLAEKAHDVEEKPIDQWHGWLPWYLLLLCKWAIQFSGNRYPCKHATEKELSRLVNMIHRLEEECGSPFLSNPELQSLPKFFRTMAFQQFWMQHSLGKWELARQHILYGALPADDPLGGQFSARFGLTMASFIEDSFLLWSWLAASPRNITFTAETLFSNLSIPASEVGAFVAALSLTVPEARTFLESRSQAIRNPCFQLSEQSPLADKPILDLGGSLLVYSRRLYERGLREFLYSQLKATGGIAAANRIARLLEQYVDRGLRSTSVAFLDEARLARAYPLAKVTDFLLPYPDATVLLEVKATDIRPTVQVFPANRPLVNELEDSIVKATIQGYSLAHHILAAPDAVGAPFSPEFFLMIVTYKDHFLGSGSSMWEEFLRAAVVPSLQAEGINPTIMPASHLVVLSIEEFDLLVATLREAGSSLPEILRQMVNENSSPQTQKLTFRQHLDPFVPAAASIPYLDDEFALLTERVKRRFKSR